jgi:hypothetical protein
MLVNTLYPIPIVSGLGRPLRRDRTPAKTHTQASRMTSPLSSSSPSAPSPGLGEPLPFLSDCLYLDYNATTPVFPEAAAEMTPFLTDCFGNPSSGARSLQPAHPPSQTTILSALSQNRPLPSFLV